MGPRVMRLPRPADENPLQGEVDRLNERIRCLMRDHEEMELFVRRAKADVANARAEVDRLCAKLALVLP